MYQKGLVEKNITFFRLAPGSPKKPKWSSKKLAGTQTNPGVPNKNPNGFFCC